MKKNIKENFDNKNYEHEEIIKKIKFSLFFLTGLFSTVILFLMILFDIKKN